MLTSVLGLPGLSSQILGLSGLNENEVFNLSTQGISYKDLISNPFAQPFLTSQLAQQLGELVGLNNGLSQGDTLDLQRNLESAFTLAASQTSAYAGPGQFLNNLEKNLSLNGITGALAANVLSTSAVAL